MSSLMIVLRFLSFASCFSSNFFESVLKGASSTDHLPIDSSESHSFTMLSTASSAGTASVRWNSTFCLLRPSGRYFRGQHCPYPCSQCFSECYPITRIHVIPNSFFSSSFTPYPVCRFLSYASVCNVSYHLCRVRTTTYVPYVPKGTELCLISVPMIPCDL